MGASCEVVVMSLMWNNGLGYQRVLLPESRFMALAIERRLLRERKMLAGIEGEILGARDEHCLLLVGPRVDVSKCEFLSKSLKVN